MRGEGCYVQGVGCGVQGAWLRDEGSALFSDSGCGDYVGAVRSVGVPAGLGLERLRHPAAARPAPPAQVRLVFGRLREHSQYQYAVYTYVVPWSEFPIVPFYTHYPQDMSSTVIGARGVRDLVITENLY